MLGSNVDPVQEGFVESLARPGKNVTGVIAAPPETDLKRLQLLTEAAPGVSKVGIFAGAPPVPDDAWQAAASMLGVGYFRARRVTVRDDIEPAFERAIAQGANGLLFQGNTPYVLSADLIASLAARHRLPAVYQSRLFVERGGLMTYAVRVSEVHRRAAHYVDRILRGARPADLPVELPTRFDLILNLRAARALGLTLSRDFMAQVDEVIE
jgi:putative ABC transport system substrate-binding protein